MRVFGKKIPNSKHENLSIQPPQKVFSNNKSSTIAGAQEQSHLIALEYIIAIVRQLAHRQAMLQIWTAILVSSLFLALHPSTAFSSHQAVQVSRKKTHSPTTKIKSVSLKSSESSEATMNNNSSSNPPSQLFKYVALDLDGTLLNSQHKVSPETIEYIQALDARGFGIMLATGRAINTVYETIIALDLPHPLPVICSNGAKAALCQPDASSETGVTVQPIFDMPVPEAVAQRTITLAKELGFFSQYYIGNDIYADARTPVDHEFVDLYKELTGAQTQCVEDLLPLLESRGLPSKQLVLFPKDKQDEVMDKFDQELSQPPYLVDGAKATLVRGYLGWFMEILNAQVCKGNGLIRLCRDFLKIEPSDVIAFGDGDNDKEFIEVAGRGLAMANARPVIREVADEILELNNDQNGVMEHLKVMEAKGELIYNTP